MISPITLDSKLPETVIIKLAVHLTGTYRDLIERAAWADLKREAGACDSYSAAQAVVALFMHAELPDPVEGMTMSWEPISWSALDDAAVPTPHSVQIWPGKVETTNTYGWLCLCGAQESPRYIAKSFAEESGQRHVRTATEPVLRP